MRRLSTIAAVSILAAALGSARLGATQADRSLTASGTISKIQAAERSFTVALSDGTQARFVWSADTQISGVLSPGARVTIRYEVAADGRNVAQQISVART